MSSVYPSMLFPLLAAGAGAVGLNYQATRELDGTVGQRRLPPMWGAFMLGAVTGLWLGVSFSPSINSAFTFMEKWLGIVTPQIEQDETSSEDEEVNRKKRKTKKQYFDVEL